VPDQREKMGPASHASLTQIVDPCRGSESQPVKTLPCVFRPDALRGSARRGLGVLRRDCKDGAQGWRKALPAGRGGPSATDGPAMNKEPWGVVR